MPQAYHQIPPSRPSSSSSNGSRPYGHTYRDHHHRHNENNKPKCLRRLDTCCCNFITYFPLGVVYGATTWAVWVEAYSISWCSIRGGKGHFLAFLGCLLYFMLNWSYTVATFSSPGTPLETRSKYSQLPTTSQSSITVKASGEARFCKKCQCRKPDRTHHCSTCNTCVLKMDHHCPWLANCLGINNYKCFVLFTSYLSVFCTLCCCVSSRWLWEVIFLHDGYAEAYMPINWVLLAVISGVVGLVVGGFSGYHMLLVSRGETTIESLEKTRYVAPLKRKPIPRGANMVGDGVLGPDALEMRERERYNEYMIEETSKQLPNAFDLGWRKNFLQVFGDKPVLWFFPIKNSLGDGWTWETSEKWKEAQRELQERRRREVEADRERMRRAGWGDDLGEPVTVNGHAGSGVANSSQKGYNGWTQQSLTGLPSPGELGSSKAARILGAREEEFSHGLGGSRYSPKVTRANKEMSTKMQDVKKKKTVMSRDEVSEDDTDDYDTSSDEQDSTNRKKKGESSKTGATSTADSLNRKAVDNWSEGW